MISKKKPHSIHLKRTFLIPVEIRNLTSTWGRKKKERYPSDILQQTGIWKSSCACYEIPLGGLKMVQIGRYKQWQAREENQVDLYRDRSASRCKWKKPTTNCTLKIFNSAIINSNWSLKLLCCWWAGMYESFGSKKLYNSNFFTSAYKYFFLRCKNNFSCTAKICERNYVCFLEVKQIETQQQLLLSLPVTEWKIWCLNTKNLERRIENLILHLNGSAEESLEES